MLNSIFQNFGGSLLKYLTPILVLILLLLGFLTLNAAWDVFAKWGWVSPPGTVSERTTTLTAQGRAIAVPDKARFSIGVVTEGDDPSTIEDQNTQKINSIIEFLKSEGVADEDIKTTGFNLFPRTDFINGRQVSAGFRLDQTLQVQTKDLSSVGTLVAGAIDRGANETFGISFFVEDPDLYRAQARAEALEKLEQKKEELENEVGIDLGDVVNFSESLSGQGPIPIPFAETAALGRGGGTPDFEPGSQEIILNVSVTYEIE